MEENQETLDSNAVSETTGSCLFKAFEWEKDLTSPSSFSKKNQFLGSRSLCQDDAPSVDSMICVLGSKIIECGFNKNNCRDDLVLFVNAGGEVSTVQSSSVNFNNDFGFDGGEILRTDESIINAGDCPSLYQSARIGNFSYTFKDLSPGDYLVDLHFAEIINTNGPKGMRVFNVFVQEEKVLSELDVYSIVGANKPLQLIDARVSISDNGQIVIRFEGIHGSPVVCGICIRRAAVTLRGSDSLTCSYCATQIDLPSTRNGVKSKKEDLAKYEQKIADLTNQIQNKTDECYEAWMSLTAANECLEKLRMELDTKSFQADTLDLTVVRQAGQLRDVSSKYERDKKFWVTAVKDLERKIKVMKLEHSELSREAHDCANSIPELNKMITAVQALVSQCEDLKVKYNEEMAKRKKLYNQVLETKGNIRVFCRCRPLSKVEAASGCATVVDFDGAKDGDLGLLTYCGSTKKTFKFDHVFTPKDDQVDVFADTSPLVVSVLDGYNVCIFAYGQTGTGKTFTMEGTEDNRGVNYRTLEELFKVAKEREDTFDYKISVSVLEVYNEQIRDLLSASPSSKKLEIRQVSEGSHHVPGIAEATVENIKEVWDVLRVGRNARAVGSNNVNEHSSRSHCLLCIMVHSKNLLSGESTKSKLWLVDLAGSERLAKTDAQGDRLKEAQNINRSLAALGDVISALAIKNSHIPYRNSKLTHLLQDSLGGDSKMLMFVQISPSEHDLGETTSSLNFATRVRGVELGPPKKQIDVSGDLQKLKQMLEKTRMDCKNKDESLRKLEENCQNLEVRLRSKDQLGRNHLDKVKELEGMLQSRTELQSQSEKQLQQLLDKLQGREEKIKEFEHQREQQRLESATLQLKVRELETKLREQQQQQSEAVTLQQKVKELENKLNHREKQLELETKLRKQQEQEVMEIESKLIQREKQLELHTPSDRKSALSDLKPVAADGFTNENASNVLRSSNSSHASMPPNTGSTLLRGVDSLHEIKRKRRSASTTMVEKEVVGLPSEMNKLPRQIDSSKALGRITRTTKLANTNNPRLLSLGRINRDQAVVGGGVKEKTRIWSR